MTAAGTPKKSVAYLGPENTNTYFAAKAMFGGAYRYLHEPTVEDVFHAVERQKALYGVVPVENSLEGAVTHTLDRFIDFQRSPVEIYGEIDQPINHFLIKPRGAALRDIRIVYSHPQALGQCDRWLRKQLREAQYSETSSTAEAMTRLLKEDSLWKSQERAAIGRRELADERRFEAVPVPIAEDNRTRFVILALSDGRRPRRPARRYKTSLMFSLKDRAGALHDALLPFKRHRINLTKIESRPSKTKAWEYYFFVDVEGRDDHPEVARALRELDKACTFLKVLGSYPAAGSARRPS